MNPASERTLDRRTQHLMTGCSHSRGSPRRSACIPAVGWPLPMLGYQTIAIRSPEKAQTAHHCAVVAPLVADDHTPTKLSGNEAIFLPGSRDEGSHVITSRFGSLRKACLMDNLDAAKPAFHLCDVSQRRESQRHGSRGRLRGLRRARVAETVSVQKMGRRSVSRELTELSLHLAGGLAQPEPYPKPLRALLVVRVWTS